MFSYTKGTDSRGYAIVNVPKVVFHVLLGIVGVIGLIALFTSFGVVDAREVGIKTRFGQVAGIIQPGLYFKMPLIESVSKMDMKVQTVDYDKNGKEGDATDTSALSAASKDLQTVWANIVVNYRLNPVNAIDTYVQYRNTEIFGASVVEPIIRETVKAITAEYTAEELVTKRQEISDRVYAALNDKLPAKGVILTQSNLTNFEYSAGFAAAIESKVTAVQNAEAAKNQLETVKYEAQQTIEKAKATAESQRIQAQSLAAQGGQDYVALKAIDKWDGHYPSTYMGPSSNIPLITIK